MWNSWVIWKHCLSFGKTTKLVLKWLYQFAFPPAVYGGFNFSLSSLSILLTWLLNYSPSSMCEMLHTMFVKSHHFDLYFPGGGSVEHLFICYWLFVYLLWRHVCSGPFVHFSDYLFVFLILRCKGSVYILDNRSIKRYMICKSFLLFFHHSIFWSTKIILMKLVYFFINASMEETIA